MLKKKTAFCEQNRLSCQLTWSHCEIKPLDQNIGLVKSEVVVEGV
jgi:hypothetical protein